MAEALGMVKRHFGREAVILSTRTGTKGGWFGLGEKPYVEITAARQSDLPETRFRGMTRSGRVEGAVRPMSVEPIRMNSEPRASTRDSLRMASRPDRFPADASSEGRPSAVLLSEIGTLKSLVQDLVRQTHRAQAGQYGGKLYDTYRNLIENAVAEELATKIIDDIARELPASRMRSPQAVRAQLIRVMTSMLPTAGPIQIHSTQGPTIVALVGPTGVGKTTTVAKLAAILCLREKRKVGLITIDTYRIAAVEQLKTYAQIIDVPLEVAMSPSQLRDAVTRMSDRDCILIDTAGRSQRDDMKIKELRGFFNVVRPHEVHLVLSSTSSENVLAEAIERFKQIGIDRLIFTKLDEALGFGVILSCLEKADARLSYLTTGQDVPDDIEVGQGGSLARLILGEPLARPTVASVACP